MTYEPYPTNVQSAPRGGFIGFLTTIPGILTAAAAVITALSGGLFLVQDGTAPSGGAATNITVEAHPAPDSSTPEDASAIDAGNASAELDGAAVDDSTATLIDECAAGYVDACQTLLDVLVDECYYGVGLSCDILYWATPVGSAYEEYGATCGGRFGWEYAGACGQL
ncbi:hypothetical protein [Blastococcus deserti]|uniref:Uncharacterized protein n=1 Tax=Blastococcus deserti TaxID=2259033 RepID=A0ABW4XHN2_9ACTN